MGKRYKQSDINPTGGNKGEVKKTTETFDQLDIPNLFGVKPKKAQAIDAFRSKTSLNGQVNDNIA